MEGRTTRVTAQAVLGWVVAILARAGLDSPAAVGWEVRERAEEDRERAADRVSAGELKERADSDSVRAREALRESEVAAPEAEGIHKDRVAVGHRGRA